MITVYFESGRHAEQVATFENEDVYIACLPVLEAIAKENRMFVTETMNEDVHNTNKSLSI